MIFCNETGFLGKNDFFVKFDQSFSGIGNSNPGWVPQDFFRSNFFTTRQRFFAKKMIFYKVWPKVFGDEESESGLVPEDFSRLIFSKVWPRVSSPKKPIRTLSFKKILKWLFLYYKQPCAEKRGVIWSERRIIGNKFSLKSYV